MKRKNNSFLYRLSISCLTFTMIPLLLFCSVYSVSMYGVVEKNLQGEIDNDIRMLTMQLDEIYNNMSFISLELLSRDGFFDSIRQLHLRAESGRSITENYREVAADLFHYGYFQDEYNLIYLDSNGYYFESGSFSGSWIIWQLNEEQLEQCTWREEADAAKGAPVLVRLNQGMSQQEDNQTLTMVRTVSDASSVMGYVLVQMPVDSQSYMFHNVDASDMLWGIYREDGVSLYGNEGHPELTPEESLRYLGRTGESEWIDQTSYNVATYDDTDTGVYTLGFYPKTMLHQQVFATVLPFAGMMFLILVLVVGWVLIFSRIFSQPLTALTSMMRETTLDNLEQRQELDLTAASDEVLYLHSAYITMRQRLNSMIQEEMKIITMQAEERYRFLQYQINPHFMYNTLNVIGMMGADAGSSDIHQSCQMLAKLMRYSLQDYRKGTLFGEEIQAVQAYLELMKMRFEHKVMFHIDFDQELEHYRIPRFTMQPFLENIFEHGFDVNHKEITIFLRVTVDPCGWCISIEDDGCGITQEAIDAVDHSVDVFFAQGYKHNALTHFSDSIGLKNTIARLYLFFDGNFRYHIGNNAQGGVTVQLRGALLPEEEP